eukprot:170093-Pleurochrysis_carterae.AAC.1
MAQLKLESGACGNRGARAVLARVASTRARLCLCVQQSLCLTTCSCVFAPNCANMRRCACDCARGCASEWLSVRACVCLVGDAAKRRPDDAVACARARERGTKGVGKREWAR